MAKKMSNKQYKSRRKAKARENKEEVEKYVEDFLETVKGSKKFFKAKHYLENFSKDKASWKFNKMLQVFILNYILIKDVFSKEFFEIFKSYFKDMSPKTKTDFIAKCTKYVQDYQDKTLYIISNQDAKFKDKEKGEKLKEYFQSRCVFLIENN